MSKEAFLNSMRQLLGDAYGAFAATLDSPAFRGVYVNTLKCSPERFKALCPFELTPTPFSPNGFYIDPALAGLGTHPLHHAGAFYAQEPSAMSAAVALDVQPGEKVLDLCAAPGGKTAALAAALGGSGLLWSNEYVASRAGVLLSNCERMGMRSVVISNDTPANLAKELGGFFDKILVDAPCSGEGMLRREKAQYEQWNERNIFICAERQQQILHEGAKMLRPGGEMVYSTCTFNKAENEDTVEEFLLSHPEFEMIPIDHRFGSPGFGMPQAKRIFPSDGGEGHFVAKLRKTQGDAPFRQKPFNGKKAGADFEAFYRSQFSEPLFGNAVCFGQKICITPPLLPQTKHLHLLRAGVLAGEQKERFFSPAHHLFSAAAFRASNNPLTLSLEDERLYRFLHGEEIDLLPGEAQKGYCALFVEQIPLGFGKVTGSKIKNHYPKGLRNLR